MYKRVSICRLQFYYRKMCLLQELERGVEEAARREAALEEQCSRTEARLRERLDEAEARATSALHDDSRRREKVIFLKPITSYKYR